MPFMLPKHGRITHLPVSSTDHQSEDAWTAFHGIGDDRGAYGRDEKAPEFALTVALSSGSSLS